ncbi:MAG: CBS domain-containing protein [Sulfolobales archaeon]
MSRNPITAHYTAKIRDVANLMYENGVGSVMIVDDKGVLVGIVTERDLVKAIATGKVTDDREVYTIMTRNPVTISPEASAHEALKKMREYNVRHLPVVDRDGKPLGMVSVRDLLDAVLTFIEVFI